MNLAKYVVKRILLAIVTVFIVCAITFFSMNAIPGGPFEGEKALSPEVKATLMERYNLDKPVGEQFVLYLKNLMHGDFGVSLKTGRDIGKTIFDSFKISAKLGARGADRRSCARKYGGPDAKQVAGSCDCLFLDPGGGRAELRARFSAAARILYSAWLGTGMEPAEPELCAPGHRAVLLSDGVHYPSDKDEHARCTRTGLCAYRPGEGSTAAAGYL